MKKLRANMGYSLEKNDGYALIKFYDTRKFLSSAVYNGGFIQGDNILILRVEQTVHGKSYQPPEVTFEEYCRNLKLEGKTAGLMTAASMDTLRISRRNESDFYVESILTSGLTNSRCAGDPADFNNLAAEKYQTGTINIVIMTNAHLSDAAMAECIITATEAKSSVLNDMNIKSPVSGKTATGTGTDAVIIVNGDDCGRKIDYAGKHVLFGEMIAKSVIKSLTESIKGNI